MDMFITKFIDENFEKYTQNCVLFLWILVSTRAKTNIKFTQNMYGLARGFVPQTSRTLRHAGAY